ncbi:MAG: biotin--[acetyl-CoA-carboxylase] ligase [Eubacterium sp.]|nr:biotin--[acetyl-CoA-carboxylase] ligase [Eubacterium sp.]
MSVKDLVLEELENNKGSYVSGGQLSKTLSVSRNSIWKAIKSLEKDGYSIDAIPNRGYCLSSDSEILSAQSIAKYCNHSLTIEVYETITSTNTVLKEKAGEGAEHGTVLVAKEQTSGRGRMGKEFYSPSQTGIYLSILLRPQFPASQSLFLTTAAAVATARAIEDISSQKAQIKWVNDIYIGSKKVCGILTEAAFNIETNQLDYAIVGIGVNLLKPSHFPSSIQDIATAVFDVPPEDPNYQSIFVANLLNYFMEYYEHFESKEYLQEYIDRSMLIGKSIFVIRNNKSIPATALAINADCHLQVRYEDGTEEWLSSGEVSTKLSTES